MTHDFKSISICFTYTQNYSQRWNNRYPCWVIFQVSPHTFHDFSIPKVIFHDFPDLENLQFEFQTFPRPVRILILIVDRVTVIVRFLFSIQIYCFLIKKNSLSSNWLVHELASPLLDWTQVSLSTNLSRRWSHYVNCSARSFCNL